MVGIKPVMPSLREKKRYLVFEVLAKRRIAEPSSIRRAVYNSMLQLYGEMGAADAGLIMLDFNASSQRGIVKVSNKCVNSLKASLSLIKNVNAEPATLKSVGISGTLRKARAKYIAG